METLLSLGLGGKVREGLSEIMANGLFHEGVVGRIITYNTLLPELCEAVSGNVARLVRGCVGVIEGSPARGLDLLLGIKSKAAGAMMRLLAEDREARTSLARALVAALADGAMSSKSEGQAALALMLTVQAATPDPRAMARLSSQLLGLAPVVVVGVDEEEEGEEDPMIAALGGPQRLATPRLRLALFRAVLAQPPEVLSESLFAAMGPPLLAMCAKLEDPFERLTAYECLSGWLAALPRCVPEGQSSATVDRVLAEAVDVIWVRWEGAGDPASNLVPKLFAAILSAHAHTGGAGNRLCLRSLLGRVMALPWTTRTKAQALPLLLPRVGLPALIELDPGVLRSLLWAFKHQGSSVMLEDCLNAVLAALSGDDAAIFDALGPAALEALADPGSANVLRGFATFAMPHICRASPPFFSRLLREAAGMDPLPYEAVMTMLQAGLAAKLVSPSSLDEATDRLVREALDHKSERARAAALAFITRSPQLVSPIPPQVADRVREFIALNAKFPQHSPAFPVVMDALKHFLDRCFMSGRYAVEVLARRKAGLDMSVRSKDRARTEEEDASALAVAESFQAWIVDFCFASLYPGAPYERRILCLRLAAHLTLLYAGKSPVVKTSAADNDAVSRILKRGKVAPPGMCTAANVAILLSLLGDPWDRLRAQALDLLLLFPSPLPGYETEAEVTGLANRALSLLTSPRLREADAGALLLRLVFEKYVLPDDLGWTARVDGAGTGRITLVQHDGATRLGSRARQLGFVRVLDQLLRDGLAAFRSGLTTGTVSGFRPAHGLFLGAMGVVRSGLDINAEAEAALTDAAEWQGAARSLIALSGEAALAALEELNRHIISEENNEDGAGAGAAEDHHQQQQQQQNGLPMNSIIEDEFDDDDPSAVGQLARTCAWLTIMESLNLAEAVAVLALRSRPAFLEAEVDLPRLGDLILDVVLGSLHRGVMEKAHRCLETVAGLCFSLGLEHRPAAWLESLFARIGDGKQTYIRRSAGVPFAYAAILRAEPAGSTAVKRATISRLLVLAKGAGGAAASEPAPVPGASLPRAALQRVHAFNVLMFLFRDSSLVMHVMPYVPEGLEAVFSGLRSAHWQVKNAAMVLYVAIIRRAIGAPGSPATLSASSFFDRFPATRRLLLDSLSGFARETAKPEDLFPLLNLLSAFKVQRDADPTVREALAPFAEVIFAAGTGHPVAHVRTVCALALAAFVPVCDVAAFVRSHLLGALGAPASLNHLHGALVQARVMLEGAAEEGQPAAFASSSPLPADTAQSLAEAALPHARSPSAPALVRAEAFKVLRLLGPRGRASTRDLDLEGAGIAGREAALLALALEEPAAQQLLLQRCLPLRSRSGWREACLTLLPALPASAASPGILEEAARAAAETGPLSAEVALAALRLVGRAGDQATLAPLGERCLDIVTRSSNDSLCAAATHALGRLISLSPSPVLVQGWLRSLPRLFEAERTELCRLAVVTSIRASRVLEDPATALPALPILFSALEDESAAIREAAAETVASTLKQGSAARHEMWALRQAFKHFSGLLGPTAGYLSFLSDLVLPRGQDGDQDVGQASAHRIFDKEDGNPHAEPLLIAQLALAELLALGGPSAQSLQQRAVVIAAATAERTGSGAAFEDDVFEVTMRCAMLGASSAARQPWRQNPTGFLTQ